MADPRFYDLNIHFDDGDIGYLRELTFLAKHLGYAGMAVVNAGKLIKSVDVDGFLLFPAAEVNPGNASKLHGQVGRHVNRGDVIAVCGGSESINRAAVENPNVDVLMKFATPKDNGFNHVLAKEASDNNVAISFDLGDIIGQRGGRRVHTLMNFRANLLLVRKYGVPYILTSNATSCYGMRSPRELIALASLFGMTREEAISGLSSIPESIFSAKSCPSGYVMDGVQELEDRPDESGDIS